MWSVGIENKRESVFKGRLAKQNVQGRAQAFPMVEKARHTLRSRQGPGEKEIWMQDGGPRRPRVSRIWPKLILLVTEGVHCL